jgi:hypothetical protein
MLVCDTYPAMSTLSGAVISCTSTMSRSCVLTTPQHPNPGLCPYPIYISTGDSCYIHSGYEWSIILSLVPYVFTVCDVLQGILQDLSRGFSPVLSIFIFLLLFGLLPISSIVFPSSLFVGLSSGSSGLCSSHSRFTHWSSVLWAIICGLVSMP